MIDYRLNTQAHQKRANNLNLKMSEVVDDLDWFQGRSRKFKYSSLKYKSMASFQLLICPLLVLVSYIKERKTGWSLYEFLTTHRDTIIKSPPFSEKWEGLETAWITRF